MAITLLEPPSALASGGSTSSRQLPFVSHPLSHRSETGGGGRVALYGSRADFFYLRLSAREHYRYCYPTVGVLYMGPWPRRENTHYSPERPKRSTADVISVSICGSGEKRLKSRTQRNMKRLKLKIVSTHGTITGPTVIPSRLNTTAHQESGVTG